MAAIVDRRLPLYVVRAELDHSVGITELATNRVYYVTSAMTGLFDCGGLVLSSSAAEFLQANRG
jgi:hypothetical protein